MLSEKELKIVILKSEIFDLQVKFSEVKLTLEEKIKELNKETKDDRN